MKRYFHVSFSHPQGFGSIQYISKDGKHPSIKELKKGFMSDEIESCCILNVIEFKNEQDFNDFNN